ncbi:MAG: DUF2934 domain-containing protein [Phycisphaerales bacterium]|nr:DUF2934 domain-containing protein [Phycisphaerales bacterium]
MSRHGRHNNAHTVQPSTNEPKPRAGELGVNGDKPTPDCIRLRAYEISQARNGGPGNAASDWIQAEQEVAAEHAVKH